MLLILGIVVITILTLSGLLIMHFNIISLFIICIVPILISRITNTKYSLKNLGLITLLDIGIIALLIWKGVYFFTPFFGEPKGMSMELINGNIEYCGCIFIFPWYLSVFFLMLLLVFIAIKFYILFTKSDSKINKNGTFSFIIWTVFLIIFSFVQSSVYGEYFPYGLYGKKELYNFDKNRSIISDIFKEYLK